MHAVDLYKDLLKLVEDRSIYLEEYARGMIGEEEQHSLELRKMLKDFGQLLVYRLKLKNLYTGESLLSHNSFLTLGSSLQLLFQLRPA